jgi:hypothetical protein
MPKKSCWARAGAGAEAVIRIYGSAEPEPKEIFTAPHTAAKFTCAFCLWAVECKVFGLLEHFVAFSNCKLFL